MTDEQSQGRARPSNTEKRAIYLDVDGVVLDKYQKPSQCLHEFIVHITSQFECYWLTTHVTSEETEHLWSYLRRNKVPEETLTLMESIHTTSWDMLKTDAINFTKDFLWFEDMPSTGELEVLKQHNAQDRIIWIDREAGDGLCKWLNIQGRTDHCLI